MSQPAAPVPPRTSSNPERVERDTERWVRALTQYAVPRPRRSLFELLVTVIPFIALWLATLFCVQHGWWLGLVLIVPAAAFLVRLFMIQHDCGHGSFFRNRRTNDALGRAIGVLTLTPYDYWRRTHAIHHATTGNLNRRGLGDIDLRTVSEYRAMSHWGRLCYRLTRHPLALLSVGPFYLFILKYRLPVGLMRGGRTPWISAMTTNVAIALLVVCIGLAVGFGTLAIVQLPITLLAGSIGIWLFYIQHQFEHTYWARESGWSYHDGALLGSTHYDLPSVLAWLTANIGVHHIHHLACQIPSYRLTEPLSDFPEIRAGERLNLRSSLRCFRLALWDEEQGRLVSIRDLARS